MFEHFDLDARQCAILAQEEARRLGHEEIGTVHLMLAVAGVAPQLLGVGIEAVRAQVVALQGSAPAPNHSSMMPFSAEAKAALEGANSQALSLGHTVIDPAHLLLALLDAGGGGARALREAGAIPSEVRERALAAAGAAPRQPVAPRERSDHAEDLRGGDPVPVTLGADAAGIGDLGNPNVDVRLLELMLVNDTPVARMLRDHGIDEVRLRELFGPPDERGGAY